ncbi:hypothetical protein V8F20_001700 [Naviculisporaceae sp. PSN 640]
MEKKRKLPARAAAREQSAKKRNITPQRSETPVPPPAEPTPDPKTTPVEEAPPSLPKAISAGKPLPTVETPQPDDLSNKDYQSIAESGVLGESLSRSRSKWITEILFEKYWTKPIKKKGVLQEEPNNPPKESMTKLGQVTITLEPHVFEATMFAVKDPKPVPPPQPTSQRPVLQYGPPNGVMPPPPTPKSSQPAQVSTPGPVPSQPQTPAQPPLETLAAVQTSTPKHGPARAAPPPAQVAHPSPHAQSAVLGPGQVPAVSRPPVASPRGMESFLTPNSVVPQPPLGPAGPAQNPPLQAGPSPAQAHPGAASRGGLSAPTMAPIRTVDPKPSTPTTANARLPAKPAAAGADPIILTLAEKAGEDPELRDLMKKVAMGEASRTELEKFQGIIDAITAESRRKGAGPSADRLLVDKRSVQYYANEVRAILTIVLQSNPKQTSATLEPPKGSNPLVIALVKLALDDHKIADMITRIAMEKPTFTDATDLKAKLDELFHKILKEKERAKTQLDTTPATLKSNGVPNGQVSSASTPQSATPTQPPAAQQALRSKGPPPPPKPDISAVVFEFAGGNGDRYLFPKFSILETHAMPAPQQQVVASFLIVRKAGQAEYPVADPVADYYQPVTIRLFTSAGRHLEHLPRVVAPEEEVRRYMDDVMDKAIRGEFMYLAMRLPRADKDGEANSDEREKGAAQPNGASSGKQNAEVEPAPQPLVLQAPQPPPPTVSWTTKHPKPEIREVTRSKVYKPMDGDDQYQNFIQTVKKKEVKE